MTAVALGPLFTRPLHPHTWSRPAGSKDYRITNRFDSPDLINKGELHRAVDAGNADVNWPLLAMANGTAGTRRHWDGALGVDLWPTAARGRLRISIWHVNAFRIPENRDVAVTVGQEIAITGNTGAPVDGKPMPAHTHIEFWLDGIRIDPEPVLLGRAPLTLEEDMQLAGFKPIVNRHVVLKAGATARRTPRFNPQAYDENKITTHVGAVTRVAVAEVQGTNLTLANGHVFDPGTRWLMADSERNENVFYHWRDVDRLEPIERTGFTQAQVDAARVAGFDAGKSAATSAYSQAGTKAAMAVTPR
jgi:hypothetical protein